MRKHTSIILTISVVVILGAGFATFQYVDRTRAQPVRDLSKMRSVQVILSEALSAHYQQHAQYPRSLTELPLDKLGWGDEGSTIRDVQAWSYLSDGLSFSMAWTNARGSALYVGGRTGEVHYSRGKKRGRTRRSAPVRFGGGKSKVARGAAP